MELLYEPETQADDLSVERMRQTIADALSQYKPMREERYVAMARHHKIRDEAGGARRELQARGQYA